jgi:hypothetical protein
MQGKWSSIAIDVLVATVTGAMAAVAIFPIFVIPLIVCVVSIVFATRSRMRDGNLRLATCGAIATTFVFVGVVTAAAVYQPTKVIEQQLSRSVTLPSTRMTLADLAELVTYNRRAFPIGISIGFDDEDKDIVVEWPSRELTVRDFLVAIESQTVLRHRFMHCGNGYTVLGGGDCSFGLYIREPKLAGTPLPRDRFDSETGSPDSPLSGSRSDKRP